MITGEHASTAEHLAEMDRLLRDIQVELEPGREPAPALAAPPPDAEVDTSEPAPQAPQATGGGDQFQALSLLAARLLASMRELLDGYEQFLVGIPSVSPPAPVRHRPTTRPPAAPSRDDPDVTVRGVAVRGYEGSDRAIIEVRLDRTDSG